MMLQGLVCRVGRRKIQGFENCCKNTFPWTSNIDFFFQNMWLKKLQISFLHHNNVYNNSKLDFKSTSSF